MKILVRALVLVALGQTALIAQAIHQSTEAACSPSVVGNGAKITIQNCGMSEEQFSELRALLRKLLSRPDRSADMLSALHSLQSGQSAQNGLITGGDSYALIYANVLSDDRAIFDIQQKGSFPLHGVMISMHYMGGFGYVALKHLEGDMHIGEWEERPEYAFRVKGHERMTFHIGFDALNGEWTENLYLARVGEKWSQAYQVFKPENPEDGGGKALLIEQYADSNFPRDEKGEVEWQKNFLTQDPADAVADRVYGVPFLNASQPH